MIVGGWLEKALMYSGVLLAFRKGKYFFVARLKVTSKKSVSITFVLILIESPSSLNNGIISFLILSSFGPFALFIAASPSPDYYIYNLTFLTLFLHSIKTGS